MQKEKLKKGQPADWWTVQPTPMIKEYITFFDEFGDPWLESDFPYTGAHWKKYFRKVKGEALWLVRADHPENSFSLDCVACAERAFPPGEVENRSGPPCGACADLYQLWIPMLDGGVYLRFLVVEHLITNALKAYQRTYVGGTMCFRYLLHLLQFRPITRRIAGETAIPTLEEMERLRTEQYTPGTEAYANLDKAAEHAPGHWHWNQSLTRSGI